MKMRYKIVIGMLLCVAILAIISVTSNASTPKEAMKYGMNDEGAYIYGLRDESITVLDIPEEIEGKKVVKIYDYAFDACSNLIEVKIPKTITEIIDGAFCNCINLEKVSLPEGLYRIGYGAFKGCSNLSEIYIPESVQIIWNEAFYNCDPNLTLVVEKGSVAEQYSKDEGIDYRYVMYDINEAVAKVPSQKEYTGTAIKPKLTIQNKAKTKVLKEGENYRLSYGKNINTGTGTIIIEGIENYYGKRTYTFNITKKNLSKVGVPEIEDYVWTGSKIKPALKIVDGNRTLVNGTDYTVKYENNKNIGTAKVTVSGKGNYTGQVERYFDILKRDITNSPTKISKVSNQVYTGKTIKPSITVKYKKTTLVENKDYTVKYSNCKKIGIGKITIKGKGVYTGTVVKEFKILPKATKIKKVAAKEAGFNVCWKAITKITGYQIQYATNNSFKDAKKKTISANNLSKTISNLAIQKRYYVRIRTYKNANGTKYYSAWSEVTSIKTKRREVKIGKKYTNYNYGDVQTITFKKGNKIEMTYYNNGYVESNFKGTYKQSGNKITATVEGYSYRVYCSYTLNIEIIDKNTISVSYGDNTRYTERYSI